MHVPQNLKISKPSTVYIHFSGPALPNLVTVKDSDGDIYFSRVLNGHTARIKFNVPDSGQYTIEPDVRIDKIVTIELPQNLPELPPAERFFFKSEPEIIIEPELDEIARHYYEDGVIVVGKRWLTMPKPIRLFILLHEKWHFFYETEDYCDMAALVDFLRMGYNRSTAFYALDNYLSDTNVNRIRVKNLFNNIQKTQKTPLL